MRTKLCILLAAAALQLGCSFLGVRRAPDDARPGEPFDCTTSNVAPALDAAAAGIEAVNLALIPAVTSVRSPKTSPGAVAALIGVHLGWMALYTGSAIWGFKQTRRCLDAKLQHCFRDGREERCDFDGPLFKMPEPREHPLPQGY